MIVKLRKSYAIDSRNGRNWPLMLKQTLVIRITEQIVREESG